LEQSFSVLIPDGDNGYALFVAHCLAHCPNVRIYVLAEKRSSPIQFSRYCRCITYKPNGSDKKAFLNTVTDVVKQNAIDVLLPTGIPGISFAIANREALSKVVALPPLPDPRPFQIANDKWLLAQFLEENGISGPKTMLVTESNLEKGIRDLEYPVLLKPTGAAGGSGVRRVESPAEIQSYLRAQDKAKLQGCFVVQSLLPGRDVDFSVLALKGKLLATTIQRGIIPNKQKFAPPIAIEFIKDERFFEASRKLFSALNSSGYAHVDTLLDARDQSINILDINARFWGSLRGSLVAGVNFPYLACLAALQIPFSPPDYELAHYYHTKVAIRESLFRRQDNGKKGRISFQETGLRFLVQDPVAEILRGS